VSRRSRQLALVFAAELAALATTATGQAFQPAGDEFQANTYTRCNQSDRESLRFPTVPSSSSGKAAPWTASKTATCRACSLSATMAAVRGSTPSSRSTKLRPTSKEDADVAPRASGGFVVTWQSWRQDGHGYAVMARRYRPTGLPQGGEFQVNTFTTSWQYYAAVAGLPDGFVVDLQSYEQDGDRGGIYAQRFDDDGAKVGGEFRVNSYTPGVQQFLRSRRIRAGVS